MIVKNRLMLPQELAVCMPKQAASACDEKAAEEPHAAVVQQAGT